MRKITKMVAITRLLGIFNVLQKGRFYVNWRSWDIQNCKYIFVNKEKCLFLYLWTCGYLSYTVGIKGGGFPSESQSLLQRYTITIFTARLFYQRRLVTRAMRQSIISQIAFLYRDRDQSKLLEHFTAFLPSQSMLVWKIWWVNCDKKHGEDEEETGQRWKKKKSFGWTCPNYFCQMLIQNNL